MTGNTPLFVAPESRASFDVRSDPASGRGGAGRSWAPAVWIKAVGIVLGVLTFMVAIRQIRSTGADFASFYAAGRTLGSGDIYSTAPFAAERERMGTEVMPFVRQPWFALVMKPMTALPLGAALWVWRGLAVAAAGVFVFCWPAARSTTALALSWSVPLLTAVLAGQDASFILALVAGSLVLQERGRHFAAGILLSLCLNKFHMFALLPVYLFEKCPARTRVAVLVGIAGQLLVDFWLVPAWIGRMVASATSPLANDFLHNMWNFRGLIAASRLPGATALEVVLGVGVFALCWYGIRHADNAKGVAIMLAGGLLISHHAYLYDALFAVPLAILIADDVSHPYLSLAAVVFLWPFVNLQATQVSKLFIVGLFVVACAIASVASARRVDRSAPSTVLPPT